MFYTAESLERERAHRARADLLLDAGAHRLAPLRQGARQQPVGRADGGRHLPRLRHRHPHPGEGGARSRPLPARLGAAAGADLPALDLLHPRRPGRSAASATSPTASASGVHRPHPLPPVHRPHELGGELVALGTRCAGATWGSSSSTARLSSLNRILALGLAGLLTVRRRARLRAAAGGRHRLDPPPAAGAALAQRAAPRPLRRGAARRRHRPLDRRRQTASRARVREEGAGLLEAEPGDLEGRAAAGDRRRRRST